MKKAVIFVFTLLLTSACLVTNEKSGSDKQQEEKFELSLRRYLLDGRRRLKRNSDNTHLYKDALYTSPNTTYFQKHQTHHLRCPSWRRGERLSSVFWYRGSTFVAKYSAPNERGKNFTAGERYRLVDDQSGLIIYNVTDEDEGLYDCRVVPTATKRERHGMITVEILDSTFPAEVVSMDSINMTLLSQNINRQDGGRIKCPHSTTDAAAIYWSLDKGEGADTDIIGAEYSNNDTLVLDKYKEDYHIARGGDLQILSLQRPQSRFWCHRFLNGTMAVGYVDVTGVGDNTHLYKDALYTSLNTAYFQKHQTHHLRCLSWQRGERLSSVFWWYTGWEEPTLVAKYSAPNERGKSFTAGERYRLVDDQSGLIIFNITDEDEGIYDCRVVPTATKRERHGKITVEILDSTFPAGVVSMDSINMTLLSQNINRQNGGRIKCPHSTTDATAIYWSLDKGEGVDTDIIGAEYSNNGTLVLDKYKEDYQIASDGDLQILSLQRPQSRFWCHRFLNGMAVGYVNVTGVVLANQERPIITGCEPLPGDECQVNFDPDEDLQLDCSVLEVYPKVTLNWKDVSECDINFQEAPLESFDNVTKTYDQYQRLIVKAGSFSAECQPKFVCNATGEAIPVQPFGVEVLQVKSGVPGKFGIILGVLSIVGALFSVFLFLFKRRCNHPKTSASSADMEANDIKVCVLDCEMAVEPTTKDHEAKQQSCVTDESQTARNQTSQSEQLKPVEEDESQTLLPQTSQPEELKPDELVTEHVEIHPSGSNSFSPRTWLMQARNIVVHIHQYVGEKTPTKRNRTKSKQMKYGKRGASYQHVFMETLSETELSPSGQNNLEVHRPENSSSPPLSIMADSTLEGEPGDEEYKSDLHEASVIQETSDTHDDPQENDDPQMSFSEAACESRQEVETHHDKNENQPEQHISNEVNSHLHLTQEEVNLQREDPPEISITEDEAGPPVGSGKILQKRKKSDGKSPPKQKKGKKTKKPSNSKDVRSKDKDSSKPKGMGKQAARNSTQPLGRDIDNGTDEETERVGLPQRSYDSGYSSIPDRPDPNPHCRPTTQQDDVNDQHTAEETSTNQSADQQITRPVFNHDCSAVPSPSDPLNPTVNQQSDDVQQTHREEPTQHLQQPDHCSNSAAQPAGPITTQPSTCARPFEEFPTQGPARANPTEQEPDLSSISLHINPQTQTGLQPSHSLFTSPGSNTITRGFDDSPKTCIPEPSLPTSTQASLVDQDDQHIPLPVLSPQSDYREPTPDVGQDSNRSRHPNRFQSDDEDMDSVKSDSGNEMEQDVHHDVNNDVGYDQQYESTPVEMDEAVAGENRQDIEMVDSEDEVVERPKSDPKERQSKTRLWLKKQNLLKTENFVDQRPKVSAVH